MESEYKTAAKQITQSRFEIMFDAINAHDTSKVADIVNMLAAKGLKRTKEEEQIFFVAKCVLDDKKQVKA